MLGLGETEGIDAGAARPAPGAMRYFNVGQYLQPTLRHLPVVEFIEPSTFARYKSAAEAMGFVHVASGPLVRSSYHADEFTLPA